MTTMTAKLSRAAETISSEAQCLVMDMRKALGAMKSLAVEFEKDGKSEEARELERVPLLNSYPASSLASEPLNPIAARFVFCPSFQVQQLEKVALEMMGSYEDCVAFAHAVKAVPQSYQPSDQMTDFKRLIETEVSKIKEASSASGQNHPLFRQFKESVWNVHHAGQPMPGEEQEDVIMTGTQTSIKNVNCPLTGKPVIELSDPVRCMDCGHIYEKGPILHYISRKQTPNCPIGGCSVILQVSKVVCDQLLRIDIEEFRSSMPAAANATNIEDFTDLNDDD